MFCPASGHLIASYCGHITLEVTAAAIAECGTGKTLISLGSMFVHAKGRAFTALVMAPPQLTMKWCRECLSTLPRVRVFLVDGVRNGVGSNGYTGVNEVRLRNGRIIREGLQTTLSELRLRKTSKSARARWAELCDCPAIFVLSREVAKLEYFWRHVYALENRQDAEAQEWLKDLLPAISDESVWPDPMALDLKTAEAFGNGVLLHELITAPCSDKICFMASRSWSPLLGLTSRYSSTRRTAAWSEDDVPGFYDFLLNRELLSVGVPEELIPRVRSLQTEGDLDRIQGILPVEAYEGLFLLAAGETVSQLL